MRESITVKRYSKALYELAVESGELEMFVTDMKNLQSAAERVPAVMKFMGDMRVERERKFRVLDEVSDEIGLGPMLRNFAKLIIDRSCAFLLKRILVDAIKRVMKHQSLAEARVMVANSAFVDKVREKVSEILGSVLNLKVRCDARADESLLGGFVLHIGDVVFDTSVMGKLGKMKEKLL